MNRILVLLALFLVSQTGFASKAVSTSCAPELALAHSGEENICFQRTASKIKNLKDKQEFVTLTKKWAPPKDFQVIAKGRSFQMVAGKKVMAEAYWLSVRPMVIKWNGKLLVETSVHESLAESMAELWAQADKNASAASGWLVASAYASVLTREEMVARYGFYIHAEMTLHQDEDYEPCYYVTECLKAGLKGDGGVPSEIQFKDMFANLGSPFPRLECSGDQITKIVYKTKNTDLTTNQEFTLRPVSRRPGQFLLEGLSAKPIHLEYKKKVMSRDESFSLVEDCIKGSTRTTACSRAWSEMLQAKPKLKEYVSKHGNVASCDRFPRQEDQDECSQHLHWQMKVPESYVVTSPVLSECLDADCARKRTLERFHEVGQTFFPGSEQNKDQWTNRGMAFYNILAFSAHPQLIMECQSYSSCRSTMARQGISFCGEPPNTDDGELRTSKGNGQREGG